MSSAVAGLPHPRDDHAVVMSRFANDCCRRMQKMCKALSKTLGPDTDDLGIRIGKCWPLLYLFALRSVVTHSLFCFAGLHSGQVVGGVLRGDKGRYQLFGSTVNLAAKMAKLGVS